MCAGSLSSEACSMVGSGAGCEWVQHAYLEIVDANFDPADISRRPNNWEEGKNVREDGVCGNTWRSPVRNHSTMLFVEKREAKNGMYDCGSTHKVIARAVGAEWWFFELFLHVRRRDCR